MFHSRKTICNTLKTPSEKFFSCVKPFTAEFSDDLPNTAMTLARQQPSKLTVDQPNAATIFRTWRRPPQHKYGSTTRQQPPRHITDLANSVMTYRHGTTFPTRRQPHKCGDNLPNSVTTYTTRKLPPEFGTDVADTAMIFRTRPRPPQHDNNLSNTTTTSLSRRRPHKRGEDHPSSTTTSRTQLPNTAATSQHGNELGAELPTRQRPLHLVEELRSVATIFRTRRRPP